MAPWCRTGLKVIHGLFTKQRFFCKRYPGYSIALWETKLHCSAIYTVSSVRTSLRYKLYWYVRNAFLHLVLFIVCWGFTLLLNIWGHIMTVPACRSSTLTNVLPHWNAMPQTQDMTSHPVTVYRHRADLSLYYPLMWNVTLEYTTTQFNLGSDPTGKSFPELPHTQVNTQLY